MPQSFGAYLGALASFLAIWISSCQPRVTDNSLNVAVASNVQYAMKALLDSFSIKNQAKIQLIVGSSGKLTAQIIQGAPFDLLVAANQSYPRKLIEEGAAGKPLHVYGRGSLALWTLDSTWWPLDIDFLGSSDLQRIAIANPKSAPYGEAAMQFIQRCGYPGNLEQLVLGESASQAIQFVRSGSCQLGMVPKSALVAGPLKGQGNWILLDSNCYDPIQQALVITNYGKTHHDLLANEFVQYLLSPDGQAVFETHGYDISKKPL